MYISLSLILIKVRIKRKHCIKLNDLKIKKSERTFVKDQNFKL